MSLTVEDLDDSEFQDYSEGVRTLDDIERDRTRPAGADIYPDRAAPPPPVVEPHDQEDEGPSRFAGTLLRRSELGRLPVVEPLIEGLISRPASVVLVGPTGVGKTALSLAMACSVATGAPFLGKPVDRCPVLYVVGEGAYGLDARVTAWEQSWQVKVTDDDLTFAVKPDSLSERSTWQQMGDAALDLGARFVILDTFSSLAPDADETKDAPQVTRRLSDLSVRIAGTAMLVHHPGWGDATRARGGYQLEANVDEVITLAGEASSALVRLKRKKVKEGPSGAVLHLRRTARDGAVGIEGAHASEADAPTRDRLVVLLGDFGDVGATAAQLEKELDVARSTVTRTLRALINDGLAREDGTGPRARYWSTDDE